VKRSGPGAHRRDLPRGDGGAVPGPVSRTTETFQWESDMGLFDKLKDAAADLTQEARDKVGDLDAHKLLEATKDFADAGISALDGADTAKEGVKGA
jgi:hypothetical protein